jgi:hypothetical protein
MRIGIVGGNSKTLPVERTGCIVAGGCLETNRTEYNTLLNVSGGHVVLSTCTSQSAFCALGPAKQGKNWFGFNAMVTAIGRVPEVQVSRPVV